MPTAVHLVPLLALLAASAVPPSLAATELVVDVYDGPKDCADSDRIAAVDAVRMHYVGSIDPSSAAGTPGREFDSSRDRGLPLEVTVGVDELIDGWDAGLPGLCRGARATLVVPPDMAYGSEGAGDLIPGDATLRFDVEVVSVTKPPPPPDLFAELDVDGDGFLVPDEIRVHFRKERPDAEVPPDLLANEDADGDGRVSRGEFGGPRMPRDACAEMLYRNPEATTLGLAVRWLCHRPREVKVEDGGDEGRGEEL